MSFSHIQDLKKKLEQAHWVIKSGYTPDEYSDRWEIERPNGDTPLVLDFQIGGKGNYGALNGSETLSNAIGCTVLKHPEINIYFGKFTGKFQKDSNEFITQINAIRT